MKKFFNVLLAALTCVSVIVAFVACDQNHEHTFSSDWTSDATHHWHKCDGEICLEVSDKAEHTWDTGTVKTEATADKAGEMTYTCTVCKATKGESFEFAGIDEDKWQDSIAEQKFDNVTINYSLVNTEMTQEHVVKITKDKVYRKMTYIIPDSSEPMEMDQVFTGDDAVYEKDMFMSIFLSLLAERDNFVWNADESAYLASEKVTASIDMPEVGFSATEEMTNGKVKFDASGNLEYFSCTLKETVYQGGAVAGVVTGEVVWTFSAYGTTVITETAQ